MCVCVCVCVQLLLDNELIDKSARGVAGFFHRTAGLDKAKMGEYMGERDDWNRAVCDTKMM